MSQLWHCITVYWTGLLMQWHAVHLVRSFMYLFLILDQASSPETSCTIDTRSVRALECRRAKFSADSNWDAERCCRVKMSQGPLSLKLWGRTETLVFRWRFCEGCQDHRPSGISSYKLSRSSRINRRQSYLHICLSHNRDWAVWWGNRRHGIDIISRHDNEISSTAGQEHPKVD